jgi:hypothetical protein
MIIIIIIIIIIILIYNIIQYNNFIKFYIHNATCISMWDIVIKVCNFILKIFWNFFFEIYFQLFFAWGLKKDGSGWPRFVWHK